MPYLDRVVLHIVEYAEVLMFRALEGGLDMHGRHIIDLANFPVLSDHQEDGNYRLPRFANTWNNELNIYLNQPHKDPALREVFQNRDFRIGLSHALNRQEIIDVVYIGQGEPWQIAPRPDSEFYDEEMAKQYTEHDVDLANEHLDRAGYAERDRDGFRLGPDGQRITFQVDVATGLEPAHIDVLELIVGQWAEVGVDMRINTMDRSLQWVRAENNDHDAVMWAAGGGMDPMVSPAWLFPQRNNASAGFAMLWSHWYVGDARGEEPPEGSGPRRQMQLYDQLLATPDADEQAALLEEIIDIAVDEFYHIGIVRAAEHVGVVRNNFHNVPKSMPEGAPFSTPAPTNPVQYFISAEDEQPRPEQEPPVTATQRS
jgi:ABC-type transport system substrate-binding protein